MFSEGIAEEEVYHPVDCSQRASAHYRHHLHRGEVILTVAPSDEPRGRQANGRGREITVCPAMALRLSLCVTSVQAFMYVTTSK